MQKLCPLQHYFLVIFGSFFILGLSEYIHSETTTTLKATDAEEKGSRVLTPSTITVGFIQTVVN